MGQSGTVKSHERGLQVQGSVLVLSGDWRLIDLQQMSFKELEPLRGKDLEIDVSQLKSIDTGSALLLLKSTQAEAVRLKGASQNVQGIFDLVQKTPKDSLRLTKSSMKVLDRIGKGFLDGTRALISLLNFIGFTLASQAQTVKKPNLIRVKELVVQLEQCAFNAVPVTALVMFLIGTVIAYLFAGQMERYGANIFVVDGVSISVCREFAPVIVAIIVAGRSGSAFTAQLGTMKINEEVDALKAMGLSVMHILILPRFLALLLSVPILVFIGDIVGIFGGMMIAKYRLAIEFETFIQRMHEVLRLKHVVVGLVKAPVFAAFIAIIGCKMGLSVENNARSVGLNTTSTVVQSIVSVILLDALFAVVLVELGI